MDAILLKHALIDPHLGHEIWNQSVVGYERHSTKIQKLSAAEKNQLPEAVGKMRVRVKLKTLGSIDIQSTNGATTHRVSNLELTQKVNTEYFLYVDAQGNVVDGIWNETNKLKGIDFAWFAHGDGIDSKYAHVGGNRYLSYGKILALTYMSVENSRKKADASQSHSCKRFYSVTAP